MKTRVHRLVDSIYGADIVLLVGPSRDLTAWLTAHGYPDDEDTTRTLGETIELTAAKTGDALWIVWLPPEAALATVAHESVHLAAEVLRDRDVVLTRESEEAFAYYVSSMFEQMGAALRASRRSSPPPVRHPRRRRRSPSTKKTRARV